MDDQERLLQLSEDLEMPIQVSSADGATRNVTERVEEARPDGAAGSCGMSWSGWGN